MGAPRLHHTATRAEVIGISSRRHLHMSSCHMQLMFPTSALYVCVHLQAPREQGRGRRRPMRPASCDSHEVRQATHRGQTGVQVRHAAELNRRPIIAWQTLSFGSLQSSCEARHARKSQARSQTQTRTRKSNGRVLHVPRALTGEKEGERAWSGRLVEGMGVGGAHDYCAASAHYSEKG